MRTTIKTNLGLDTAKALADVGADPAAAVEVAEEAEFKLRTNWKKAIQVKE